MRVLRALFFFTIGITILGGSVFLIAREFMLIGAVSQVRSSVNQLRRIAVNSGSYAQQCREKGVTDQETSAISHVQLRFDTPTSYVLEVVCNQLVLDPIEVSQVAMPMFAQKSVGSSGLFISEELSGIGIEVLGRSRGIFVQDRDIWYDSAAKAVGLPGPVTSCSGHGFHCCQAELSEGSGLNMTEVTDCPRSCYQQCNTRPLVLALTTQPYFEPATRVLTVPSGQPIEAGFVVDGQGAKSLLVTLDFGDGTQHDFTTFDGRESHVYSCAQARCEYQIKVAAVNEQGIESVETSISVIEVIVQ